MGQAQLDRIGGGRLTMAQQAGIRPPEDRGIGDPWARQNTAPAMAAPAIPMNVPAALAMAGTSAPTTGPWQNYAGVQGNGQQQGHYVGGGVDVSVGGFPRTYSNTPVTSVGSTITATAADGSPFVQEQPVAS